VARHSLKTIFTDTNILLISLDCKTLRRW